MKPLGKWVRKERYMNIGTSFGTSKATGAKKRGIDYHRAVFRQLRTVVKSMDGWTLMIEPWYRNLLTRKFRQPDAVLLCEEYKIAIVIEVKLNWKDGRDLKLVDEYLHIVKDAHDLHATWPLLITQCLRGYRHPPILHYDHIERCQSWLPGDPTPLMLALA